MAWAQALFQALLLATVFMGLVASLVVVVLGLVASLVVVVLVSLPGLLIEVAVALCRQPEEPTRLGLVTNKDSARNRLDVLA